MPVRVLPRRSAFALAALLAAVPWFPAPALAREPVAHAQPQAARQVGALRGGLAELARGLRSIDASFMS